MLRLWPEDVEARIRAAGKNLDPQVTPDEVIMCKRCVMTNQRPRITFDEDGVCSACRFAERKASGIDWNQREEELLELLAKHRSREGPDIVVPLSGGKDSLYVAHQLKHVYGMTPLCVKWAPFMYTDIGRRNMEIAAAEFDVIEITPAQLTHRKLARLALEYLGDPFEPFVYGQLNLPMQIAEQYGIGLVMFGENGEAEYGGDTAANDHPRWEGHDWDRVYTKGAGGVSRLFELGHDLGCFGLDEINRAHPAYWPVPMPAVQFHWFSYYKRWHPMNNYYYAAENCGFEAHDERSEGTYTKFASLDDKLDGLHYYMGFVKFGIGRCTSDAAQQVRNGDIDRDEALALVERYDGEFPERHIDECLWYLGLTWEHLETIVARFACSHSA